MIFKYNSEVEDSCIGDRNICTANMTIDMLDKYNFS